MDPKNPRGRGFPDEEPEKLARFTGSGAGTPNPRPETTPQRMPGTPGQAPATMPTQQPGRLEPSGPPEQPRPHPPRPVPQQKLGGHTGVNEPNQGEGDRVSARRYEDNLRAYIAGGYVSSAARDAERAVEGDEAGSLRAAEAAGKRPAEVSLVDRAKGLYRRVVQLIKERRASRHR